MPGSVKVVSWQMMKSGSSIGANITEGDGSQTEPDFLTKYSIALKEVRETLYWLDVIIRAEILPSERVPDLYDECNELVAILTAICKTIKGKRKPPNQP